MSQTTTIQTPQDYVNYTFNIEARGVAEVSSELLGLSNTVQNILGQLAFKTSEFLTHTETISIGIGTALTAAFTSATQSAMNFQQQVANVQAIGGESINGAAIGDAAMEYSNKFGLATSSMTEGLEALARAGITSTDVMKNVLAEGVKLAKLEGIDLEESINSLISTTNLLSQDNIDMNAPDYAQALQDMNQRIVSTSESSPINAQNIIHTLQHVGGYASASGIDQEDLFAVIAQLGGRGTKGDIAGTSLRAFISAGQKDTAQRALSRIGLNVSDLWNSDGETMLSISDMKDIIDNAMESRGYSTQEKLEFYSDFAGYKQANQIMKIDTAEVRQYKESINEAWSLGHKLDTILNTVRGNLDRIRQILTNFMTKVGSKMLTIVGALLTPIRVFLEFVTALPGMDLFTSLALTFITFKTGLMIFNKIVPAVSGFASGISQANQDSKSLANLWSNIKNDMKEAKEIMVLLRNRDQAGLTAKHYQTHGLSAKNKSAAVHNIVGQMYMASDWYQQNGRIPWNDLELPFQDMLKEHFKATPEFQKNYKAYVDAMRQDVQEVIKNPVVLTDVDVIENPIEAINVHVGKIFDLLKSDRTAGTSDEVTSNLKKNAQANIISKIMKEANIHPEQYGNYEFDFRDDEEGFDNLRKATIKAYQDLQRKVERFSNTDFSQISEEQKNTYRKVLYREAMTPEGKKYAARANESEVRFALNHGRFENANIPWYQGIKDSQIREMGNIVNLDMSDFHETTDDNDQRQEYISKIYDILNTKSHNERQSLTEQIVQATNKKWQLEATDRETLTVDPAKILQNNANIARQITQQLHIRVDKNQSYADAVHEYFANENNQSDMQKVDTATQIIFDNLKHDNDFSILEQRELRYVMENLQRLRNTYQYFSDNNMHTDFQNEMSQILEGMTVYNSIFRKGGAELGNALAEGFIIDGLGIHSPGFLFWAFVNEATGLNERIMTFKDIFSHSAAELGSGITTAFDNSLNMDMISLSPDRVFDTGIEYISRQSDVIQNIINDFDKDEFRTDDEIDLPYDLLPLQIDIQDDDSYNKKVFQDFSRPYGFDVSNYQRFGANFGTSITTPPFQTILTFANSLTEFPHDKFDTLFDETDIENYFFELNDNLFDNLNWLAVKNQNPFDIDSSTFDTMNKIVEQYYFDFLSIMSQEITKTIKNSQGIAESTVLYRGGRIPTVNNNQHIGEFLGATSSSYTQRIADMYANDSISSPYTTKIYTPEETLGWFLNSTQLGGRTLQDGVLIDNVLDNQLEYLFGSGQPVIELPHSDGSYNVTGGFNYANLLALTPDQAQEVQDVIVDEVSTMVNTGRTVSDVLNQTGIETVQKIIDAKKQINYEIDPSFSNSNYKENNYSQEEHRTPTNPVEQNVHVSSFRNALDNLWDATVFFRGVKRKKIVPQEDFFKVIEDVYPDHVDAAKRIVQNEHSSAIMDDGRLDMYKLHKSIAETGYSFHKPKDAMIPPTRIVSARDIVKDGRLYSGGGADSEYWRFVPGTEQLSDMQELLKAVIKGEIPNVDLDTRLFRVSQDSIDEKQSTKKYISGYTDEGKFSRLFGFESFSEQSELYQILFNRKLPKPIWSYDIFHADTPDEPTVTGFEKVKVSPKSMFEAMQNYPHLWSTGMSRHFIPYIPRGVEPTPEEFKKRNLYDKKFINLPAAYGFFIDGINKSDVKYDKDMLFFNENINRQYAYPQNIKTALEAINRLGINAVLDDKLFNVFDYTQPMKMGKSYDRLMSLLAYSRFSSKQINPLILGYNSSKDEGIVLGPNTTNKGPLGLLETLLHESAHAGLLHQMRGDLNPGEDFALPEFTHPDALHLTDYDHHLLKEFEANWVTFNVLKNLNLFDKLQDSDQERVNRRVKNFYKLAQVTGNDKYFVWELYDEWIQVVTENIDKFIELGEAFQLKYSNLDKNEIYTNWDTVRNFIEDSMPNNTITADMPASIFSSGYNEYLNDILAKQNKAQKDFMKGYKDVYNQQQDALNDLYDIRTQSERAKYGRWKNKQKAAEQQQIGEENAAKRRKWWRDLYEEQKKPYQEERQRQYDEEMKRQAKFNRPLFIAHKWETRRNKLNEALNGGYYYFGGKRHKRSQTDTQQFVNKWGLKGIDWAEQIEMGLHNNIHNAYKFSQQYAQETGTENLEFVQNKVQNAVSATTELHDVFVDLANVFPLLTPAVTALNTALKVEEMISTGLTTAINILNFSKEMETESTFLQTMANWAASESALQAAIGETALTLARMTAAAIEKTLGFLFGLTMGQVLLLISGITSIIAVIGILHLWEKKHAEALKASQKALEENTAKSNVALSQYRDMKKARENETDAMKRQQLARKESIALYQLESARIKRRNSIHAEAKLRNDAVWGEYGARASFQKMGWLESFVATGTPLIGTIAKWLAGDFESQYEKYDGTTANIRQIKENTVGNFNATAEQRYVSSVYDKNSMFFAEVEAYKEPLTELYDRESMLIEQYGSIDLARGSSEFRDAVQEFADATGVNGKTAVMMLDWLQTENRVNQATIIGKARISAITARADAEIMGVDAEGLYGLADMNNLGDAMIVSQWQEMMNEAKTQAWWQLLYTYLDTVISILLPWKWGDIFSNMKKIGIRQNELSELDSQGNDILKEMLDNDAERQDYGTGEYALYDDTPFGGALNSLYAEDENITLTNNKHMDFTNGSLYEFGSHEKISSEMPLNNNTLLPHTTAPTFTPHTQQSLPLDEEPVPTSQKNTLIPISQDILFYQRKNNHLLESINNTTLNKWYISGHNNGNNSIIGRIKNALWYDKGFGVPPGVDSNDTDVQNELDRRQHQTEIKSLAHGTGGLLSYLSDTSTPMGAKGTSRWGMRILGKILNPQEVQLSKYIPNILKNLLTNPTGTISHFGSNIFKGVNQFIDDPFKAISKLKNNVFKTAGHSGDDIFKTAGKVGDKSLAKTAGEVGGKGIAKTAGKALVKAAPLIGPFVTAGFSIAEHNPFEKHYNEDGSEKRAFQSAGEVGGEIGGSIAAALGGLLAGPLAPIAEMGLGLVLEPLGKAVGGIIGWGMDEVVNGIGGFLFPNNDNESAQQSMDFTQNSKNVYDNIDASLKTTSSDFNNISQLPNKASSNTSVDSSKTVINIQNININTEDDPEKIKTAFMNLMIELGDQVTPRQVSRTIGEKPTSSQNNTQSNITEGTDSNSDNTNNDTNNNTNTNNI